MNALEYASLQSLPKTDFLFSAEIFVFTFCAVDMGDPNCERFGRPFESYVNITEDKPSVIDASHSQGCNPFSSDTMLHSNFLA